MEELAILGLYHLIQKVIQDIDADEMFSVSRISSAIYVKLTPNDAKIYRWPGATIRIAKGMIHIKKMREEFGPDRTYRLIDPGSIQEFRKEIETGLRSLVESVTKRKARTQGIWK